MYGRSVIIPRHQPGLPGAYNIRAPTSSLVSSYFRDLMPEMTIATCDWFKHQLYWLEKLGGQNLTYLNNIIRCPGRIEVLIHPRSGNPRVHIPVNTSGSHLDMATQHVRH
jgi:hypothetical protein